ncbi:MAG: ATP phosphoribosyltransferase regulatory subunit [Clostridia bacterium]|nr:ATP phosphoribosyltransferase regulatory subunit [Clostridia bacterium]
MRFSYELLDDSEKTIFALRSLYRESGYRQYRMSKFEEYDLYSKNKDYLISDSLITFTDTNGKLKALKPDVTLSIIKNLKDSGELQKLCYNESVYRISKGTGSFKEILQTGIECLGKIGKEETAEVLSLAAQSLEAISENYVLQISDLDVLSDFVCSISSNEEIQQSILKCVGEKNLHGIDAIVKENELDDTAAANLKELLTIYGTAQQVFPKLEALAKGRACEASVADLKETIAALGESYIEKVQIDFSAAGNMNYYNGVIFEGFIGGLAGSVLSGGRYDKLMKKMGRKSSAIGFAVYLDELDRLNVGGGK